MTKRIDSKNAMFVDELLRASKMIDSDDLCFAAEGWEALKGSPVFEVKNCELCHASLVNVTVLKNKDMYLFVGCDCWEKLQILQRTGELVSISDVKKRKRKRKSYYNKKAGSKKIAESITKYLLAERDKGGMIPPVVLKTLNHIELLGYPDNRDGADALLEFYKNTRLYKVGNLADDELLYNVISCFNRSYYSDTWCFLHSGKFHYSSKYHAFYSDCERMDYPASYFEIERKNFYYGDIKFKGKRYSTRNDLVVKDSDAHKRHVAFTDILEDLGYPVSVTQNGFIELESTLRRLVNFEKEKKEARLVAEEDARMAKKTSERKQRIAVRDAKNIKRLFLLIWREEETLESALEKFGLERYSGGLFLSKFLLDRIKPCKIKDDFMGSRKYFSLNSLANSIVLYKIATQKKKRAIADANNLKRLFRSIWLEEDTLDSLIDEYNLERYSGGLFLSKFLLANVGSCMVKDDFVSNYKYVSLSFISKNSFDDFIIASKKRVGASVDSHNLRYLTTVIWDGAETFESAIKRLDLEKYSHSFFSTKFLFRFLTESSLKNDFLRSSDKYIPLESLLDVVNEYRELCLDDEEAELTEKGGIRLRFYSGVNKKTKKAEWQSRIGNVLYVLDRACKLEVDCKNNYLCRITHKVISSRRSKVIAVEPYKIAI